MRLRALPFALVGLVSVAACSSDDADGDDFPAAKATAAIDAYKQVVIRSYAATFAATRELQDKVDAFVAAPSEAGLEEAKAAWIAARVAYAPTEAYRFYDGPIDDPETGPEGRINGWPLDEFEIDYTRDTPDSGLVNDLSFPDLTKEVIAEQNEKKGEKAITSGYHAIEFLLWGQDDATPGTGPGKRSYLDYVETSTTAKNQKRRGTYLKNVTALLVDDLRTVTEAWTPGLGFARTFGVEATDPATQADAKKEAISKILRSLGSLAKAELSGERMTVAFKNRSQEDEHSCFSDTTATDFLGNGLGIENVWLGRYDAFDGAGVDEVVAAVAPTLASKTTADIADAVAKLRKLDALQKAGTPIDVILQAPDGSEGRVTMLEAIKALKLVGEDVEKDAAALGLTVTLEEPTEEL